jgi:hypothetical protein
MATSQMPGQHGHLTFKGNLKHTRYGWLRLTPAYSVHLVGDLLDHSEIGNRVVLDPFCGTGTTALVCAERGIRCDTVDINPFLIWLTAAKTHRYAASDITGFQSAVQGVAEAATQCDASQFQPPLFQIEKWWDPVTLPALARMMWRINDLALTADDDILALLKIAFCRTMIELSNVSFGHQSMSFKASSESPATPMFDLLYSREQRVLDSWARSTTEIAVSASSAIIQEPRALLADARSLDKILPHDQYACVITSPPYPNRMSYIRELRPYMYWLGYLQDARSAGELDWQAIGGTWGYATSNVAKWTPQTNVTIAYPGFMDIIERIDSHSPILSRYVHKYFYDMVQHVGALFAVVRPGGSIHYAVGNSKFYDVLLPVEEIFASLFAAQGFEQIHIKPIRKRSSKKELFEFIVSARKPL